MTRIPGGLLLFSEDALFYAGSCAEERLEEIHFVTFLQGLLARVTRGAAVPGQGCSPASATPEGTAQIYQSMDLTRLMSARSPLYCRFALCSP